MTLPAAAADLGGNCCADLEERVAELEATTARKGNRKVSLAISGQVTTGVMAWDADGLSADARGSDTYVVDNTNAGASFFVLSGNAKVNPTLTAGFEMAVSISAGARSNHVGQNDSAAGDDGITAGDPAFIGNDSTVVLVRANWYIDSQTLGKVTVGRINTASAGVTGIDLGGISVIANANVGYWNAGFDAGATSWSNLLGGGTVNGSGLSRANAVSYTSPTFSGFQVQAAWGEDDLWDVALRYAGEFSGFRLAAAIGYADNVGGLGEFSDGTAAAKLGRDEISQVKGSASLLHIATGLFVNGTYLTQDNDVAGSKDTVLWQVQGGIAKNWTGLGNTVLYGEYANVSDAFGFASSDVDIWGLGIVQHIDAAAMEVFLAYRSYDGSGVFTSGLEVPAAVDAQFDAVFGGARIRF